MSEGSGPLWAGRFSTQPAPEAEALGRSLEVDERLAFEDAQAGIAHVAALRDVGLVTAEEQERLDEALIEVRDAIVRGSFPFEPHDEDIHSAIERGVTRLLGDVGAKLHAGRSRNDLVATDVRQVWHDPERPFRVTRSALRRWVADGDWVLLFNAITLASTPVGPDHQ